MEGLKWVKIMLFASLEGRDYLENQGIDGKTTLKWISGKSVWGGGRLDLSGFG